MLLLEAKDLTKSLMRKHGLIEQGWRFKYSTSHHPQGRCHYGKKLITMSQAYVGMNERSMIRNTILHEIAHALVGPGHHHNETWRMKAVEIGCNGEQYTNPKAVILSRYAC